MDVYDRTAYPSLQLEGVEIDPVVAGLGPRFFGLDQARTPIHVADGRSFVAGSTGSWDIIVVDAYSQQIYIPFHLTTKEFFSLLSNHLNPQGVVAFNVNATTSDSRLLASLLRTVREVFPHLFVIQVPDSYNYLVIAGRSPIRLDAVEQLASRPSPLADTARSALRYRISFPDSWFHRGLTLTDDKAPIEYLTDSMIWDIARREVSSP
jgi:spermidine synthase